jgi:hypothetical protein
MNIYQFENEKDVKLNYYFGIKFNNGIKFNTSLIPPNFHNYQLMNLNLINEKDIRIINLIKYLDFSFSTFIVIESPNNQINLIIGGIKYTVTKSILFFPILIGFHKVSVGLTPDIKIYTSSVFDLKNNYNEESHKLFNFLISFNTIFFDIYDDVCQELLVFRWGMYGYIRNEIDLEYLDESKFYLNTQNEFAKKNYTNDMINNEIFFIDKYVQSDILKFCNNI